MEKHLRLFVVALATALALLSGISRAADVDPRVVALVRASGTALHTSAMPQIHVLHLTEKIVSIGLSGTGDSWVEVGGTRSSQRFSTPPLAGGSGWDGHDSWNLDKSGLVWVDGSTAGRSAAISQGYLFGYDLWTPNFGGATVSWGGSKSAKGHAYDVLTVTPPGSALPFDLWFDAATHLPVRMVQNMGSVTATTTLSDYRSVHGLMIPFSVVSETSDGNSTSAITTAFAVNPADGDAQLAKPASTVADFSIANGKTQTTIPIQISENHVYLDVMLNGKGPFHFIFDTGGVNVVDPAIAKEVGALGSGSMQATGVGSATESTSFANIRTLQVGDATVKDQIFFVLPVRKGFGLTAGLPVDGLIGFEVLSRFVTTFDYANKQVVLQMPNTYTAPKGASVIPIVQNGQQPQFACSIDSVPTACTVDTGARDSASFFSPFLKANPQVVPKQLTAVGVDGFGVGGPSLGRLGRIQTLSFGDLTLHDIIGDYTIQTQGAFASPFVGANIGGAVWKRFSMTLDYGNLTMTLVPNTAFDARDAWDRSGMFLINNGGIIATVDVRAGTPAAKAGLVKGETIVSIDGTPTSSLTLKEIRDRLSAAPGTVVHLTVKAKDGTTSTVALTLADYV